MEKNAGLLYSNQRFISTWVIDDYFDRKLQMADQRPEPVLPLALTCQYNTLPDGRLLVGV